MDIGSICLWLSPADLCALGSFGGRAPLHVYFLSELPYEARTYQIVKVLIKKNKGVFVKWSVVL